MKKSTNKSPAATQKLLKRCYKLRLLAEKLDNSVPRSRRYSPNGSTFSAQKIILINGIRMSLGQADQYIKAREKNAIERENLR